MKTASCKKSGGWSFILFPASFVIITTIVLYITLYPTLSPFITLIGMLSQQDYSAKPTDLFDGLAEDIAYSATMINRSEMIYPQYGDKFGELIIEGTNVDVALYYGDGKAELNKGVGIYIDDPGAGIPGEGKTILVAGHTVTHFNGLKDVKEGALVTINTHYGTYTYEITEMKVAQAMETTSYDFTRTDENLIMYTCYPFNQIGLTPYRYFVYAKYLSGPPINPDA